jgi:hypothetical protein
MGGKALDENELNFSLSYFSLSKVQSFTSFQRAFKPSKRHYFMEIV